MHIQFKHQQFQADASKAVCDVFTGQPYQIKDYTKDMGIGADMTPDMFGNREQAFRNSLVALSEDSVLENLQRVQRDNYIQPSAHLVGHYNLTIEMETGVGKTYTYIKTMFDLNQKYGWSKFIVVVPSIAIREGVFQSFQMTQDHFAQEYKQKIRFFIYDSAHLNNIDQFASDSHIHVMIINAQAFASKGKDARRIYMELDEFRSRRPIDIIAATNPIVIMDEPQSLGGEATTQGIKNFNPLMVLRYSATHRKEALYNMVYRLDAMEAYNKRLVKKIAVKGISVSQSNGTGGYLYCGGINLSQSSAPRALLEFNMAGKTDIRKTQQLVNVGTNLYDQSNHLDEYKGYIVSQINGLTDTVEFANGVCLKAGQVLGDTENSEQIRRIQIRETILSHLEREHQLFYKGIKVLSLFFIDEVVKYKDYDKPDQKGVYAHIFEEEYSKIVDQYIGELGEDDYGRYLKGIAASQTHKGYFSEDKNHHIIDSKIDKKDGGSTDSSAYDLIMKNKERLLDRAEPVRFIFSHSALKEGWDNPNVFQICTLKHSTAEVRKRQEVGRGLRLAVNQEGERMDVAMLGEDVHRINILTIIASESYDSFAKGLQNELAEVIADRPLAVEEDLFKNQIIKDEQGENAQEIDKNMARKIYNHLVRRDYVDDKGALTEKYYEDKNAGKIIVPEDLQPYNGAIVGLLDRVYDPKSFQLDDPRKNNVEVCLKTERFHKKEFQELWQRINIKSVYTVDFNSDELIQKAIAALDSQLRLAPIVVEIETGKMDEIASAQALKAGEAFSPSRQKIVTIDAAAVSVKYDLVGKMVEQTGLTRQTIVKILKGIQPSIFDQFKGNPEGFIIKAARLINEQKATVVIEHIMYSPLNDTYDSTIFTEPGLKKRLNDNTIETQKNVFDHLIFDSNTERDFAQELEKNDEVIVYAKLPKGFYIPTPVGKYNPDWAIVFEEENVKHIYFVAETKGDMQTLQLTGMAKAKAACAIKHFAAISHGGVKYAIVDTYAALKAIISK